MWSGGAPLRTPYPDSCNIGEFCSAQHMFKEMTIVLAVVYLVCLVSGRDLSPGRLLLLRRLKACRVNASLPSGSVSTYCSSFTSTTGSQCGEDPTWRHERGLLVVLKPFVTYRYGTHQVGTYHTKHIMFDVSGTDRSLRTATAHIRLEHVTRNIL
jgi:hypothetical protein